MFNKEGIPLFVITIPILCIIFISFFTTSYHLKISQEYFQSEIQQIKKIHSLNTDNQVYNLEEIIQNKKQAHESQDKEFLNFMIAITVCILFFMILFTLLMTSIINNLVKKYINRVKDEKYKLKHLNETLASKVEHGIAEGKRKDKAILEQSKLARMGSMISMIAHQWRQPLSVLSGVLMELETATRFNKVNDTHILNSIDKSNDMIDFMSNTIDDFRNFYKPDKKKEHFYVSESCRRALKIVSATLENLGIELVFDIKRDKKVFGYPTEYSQVILNLITNAQDELVEKKIKNPKITMTISTKGMLSVVKIKDNAGGIKEENLELIFDPYYSTKDSTKGTGLGLYISKLIIEKNMGGDLSVENGKEGAIFTILVLE